MSDLSEGSSCVGIIAGAGPDAGLVFWRKLLDASRQRLGSGYRGDVDAPRVRIISEPTLGRVMQMDAFREAILLSLHRMLTELNASCDSIVLACHALQEMGAEAAPDVASRKLISLPALARDYIRRSSLMKIGLLGAPSVTADRRRSPYSRLWEITEVEVPSNPAAVLDLIREIKRVGAHRPEIRDRFARLVSSFSAQNILIACTDFSELVEPSDNHIVTDTLELAVQTIVERQGSNVVPPMP